MSSLKKVLIVSEYYPPFLQVASKRWGELTAHMEKFGFQPWVITTHGEGNLKVLIPEERILRVGVHHRPNILAANAPEKTELSVFFKAVRGLIRSLQIKPVMLDRLILSWGKAVMEKEADFIQKMGKPDIVIGSFSPATNLFLARRLAKKYNAKWIADFRDMGALYTENRNYLSLFFDRAIERRLLKSASALITVSQFLSDLLRSTYGKTTEVIYNGHDRSAHSSSFPNLASTLKSHRPYLYFAGLIVEHHLPCLEILFQALKNHPELSVVIRSLGSEEISQKIKSMVSQFNFSTRVHLLPAVTPDLVAVENSESFANLVLEDMSQTHFFAKGTLTGKLLQLLLEKPPILSIARADSEIGDVLKKTQKGRLSSTAREIDDFLSDFKSDPGLFSGNLEAIEEFSKTNQARRLCSLMENVVQSAKEMTSER